MTNDSTSLSTLSLAQRVWDYHHVHHDLAPSDAILVLCSHDLRVAERGAALFLEGWAPLLIVSGGLGSITRALMTTPEADQFAAIARGMGVPADRILIENRSTNTGENILLTQRLLRDEGLDPASFIVVQKPYMERRAFATFRKLWPGKRVVVTSPPATLEEYLRAGSHESLSSDDVINIMLGDLQRIRLYPAKGFQIEQPIPDDVWEAFEALVARGYDKRLIAT